MQEKRGEGENAEAGWYYWWAAVVGDDVAQVLLPAGSRLISILFAICGHRVEASGG